MVCNIYTAYFLSLGQIAKHVFRCVISNILVIVGIGLGVTFTIFLTNYWMRMAGFLEWALTYTGALWLLVFVGYLK